MARHIINSQLHGREGPRGRDLRSPGAGVGKDDGGVDRSRGSHTVMTNRGKRRVTGALGRPEGL